MENSNPEVYFRHILDAIHRIEKHIFGVQTEANIRQCHGGRLQT